MSLNNDINKDLENITKTGLNKLGHHNEVEEVYIGKYVQNFFQETVSVEPIEGIPPASGEPAKISQWLSWITNRIKAITGKANWYDTPDTALSDIVIAAAPNKVLKLNADGKLPASITGDAQTLEGKTAADFAAADHQHPLSVRTGTIPDQGVITPAPGYSHHQYFVSLCTINGYDSPFDIPIEQRGIYPYFKNVAVDTTRVGYICTIDQNLRVTARVLADNNSWISGTANYMEIAWN